MIILLQFQSPQHSYKVKIINPHRKSDMIVRYLHNYTSRFESAIALRMKLVEEFKDVVPDSFSFSVGYFEGQNHSKIWLVTREDFSTMYGKYPKGEITLWCDGRTEQEDDISGRKKRKRDEVSSKLQEKEDEVDDIFKQLKEKHGEKYDTPRLRLWARSICSKIHDDLDSPPDLPAFRDATGQKKAKRETLTDALTGAEAAFTTAFKSTPTKSPPRTDDPLQPVGVSPGRSVELRMKNFEQLRYLQQLYDDGILTTTEYEEQKEKILSSLRKLN